MKAAVHGSLFSFSYQRLDFFRFLRYSCFCHVVFEQNFRQRK